MDNKQMSKKQMSKQERRLAKGLAAQAATVVASVVPEAPAIVVPSAQVEVMQDSTPAPEAPAPEAPKADGPKVPTLSVKAGLTLRGGRGEWYKLLLKYDGKPVAEFVAAGRLTPASHYTARSTKCGQPKTPESRLSWFKRAGIVTIS